MTYSERLTQAIVNYRRGDSFRKIERKLGISAEEIYAALKIPTGRTSPTQVRVRTKCDACCWKNRNTNICAFPNCFLKTIGKSV